MSDCGATFPATKHRRKFDTVHKIWWNSGYNTTIQQLSVPDSFWNKYLFTVLLWPLTPTFKMVFVTFSLDHCFEHHSAVFTYLPQIWFKQAEAVTFIMEEKIFLAVTSILAWTTRFLWFIHRWQCCHLVFNVGYYHSINMIILMAARPNSLMLEMDSFGNVSLV